MPELPDVEVFRRYFHSTSLHQRIAGIALLAHDLRRVARDNELEAALVGKEFTGSRRHGKYFFADLEEDKWLMLHFGMTGYLKYFRDTDEEPQHMRLRVDFENGAHLGYTCQRKLGSILVVENMTQFIKDEGLGPDALDPTLDAETFSATLSASRSTVKAALMEQERIAGIGNIYSDEILYRARVHPGARANRLNSHVWQDLFNATGEVLQTAIDCEVDPERFPADYLLPHRHKDGTCPCGGELVQRKISGRTAYFCPACQTRGVT